MRRRGCKRRGDERMRVAVIMLTTRVVSEHSTHVGRGAAVSMHRWRLHPL